MQATAFHFLLLTVSGWVNRRQQAAIAYLREENRVLRAQLGPKRPRLTDGQRRGLAEKGRVLGRKALDFVVFAIELDTRRVHIAGIVHQPYSPWMMQVGRNLLDAVDGFLLAKKYLILDRDPLDTRAFRRLLRDSGVKPVLLPARSPNLKGYTERFVRSIRDDCLNHVALLGEHHLRNVVSDYVAHYHGQRNHQGIGNLIIEPYPAAANANGQVQRRQRLGGLLNHYYREAA